jgi:FKBP-type peptidyl-prolyl cis-trans isomerase SlyD
MPYLHGGNNIVPGLEKELVGLETGAKIQVAVQPEEGYGPVIPEAIATIDKDAFGEIEDIQPGMQFQAQGPEGQIQIITIKEVTDEGILVDGNHPLAGKVLNFEVEITEVREATAEELEHGHPHLEDGESCEH